MLQRRLISGFTMLELLVVVLIGAILAAIAIPNYRQFIQNTQAASTSNDFLNALAYARTEAIRRGSPVSVCASANTTQSACGTATNWANGWIVFLDPTAGGAVGAASNRLRTHDVLQTNTTLTTTVPFVNYAATGFLNVGAGTFTIVSPGCVGNSARTVTVSNSGLAVVAASACP